MNWLQLMISTPVDNMTTLLPILFLIPLISGQIVQDMFYKSVRSVRTTWLYPDQCAFPCQSIDDKYLSLEIGVFQDAKCPDPLLLDYDLSNDITTNNVYYKPCNTTEKLTICSYCLSKKYKTISLAQYCQLKYPVECSHKIDYQYGKCINCVNLWTIPKSEF